MALTYSTKPVSSLLGSWTAPSFLLPGVDGRDWSLADFLNTPETRGLLVIFMCNHCPYVIAVQDRINAIARDYASRGIRLVGINPNDSDRYPADGFEAMKARAKDNGFVFPYLRDDTQAVARLYEAVCTPDPYLFEKVGDRFVLVYRGRIDDSWQDEASVKSSDLRRAIDRLLLSEAPDPDPIPSMGCSIKWRPFT